MHVIHFRTTSSWQSERQIIHSHFEIISDGTQDCGSKNFSVQVLNFSLAEMPLYSIALKLQIHVHTQLISSFGRQRASNLCNKWFEKLCGRISWTFRLFNCHCVGCFFRTRIFICQQNRAHISFHNICLYLFWFCKDAPMLIWFSSVPNLVCAFIVVYFGVAKVSVHNKFSHSNLWHLCFTLLECEVCAYHLICAYDAQVYDRDSECVCVRAYSHCQC